MYDDYFTKAHALTQAGEAFATATVVRAERPTSGKPGDRAIITAGGELFGWIGGSCAQPTVVREALAALHDGESRLVRLSPDPGAQQPREGLRDVAMTCYSGGTLEIFVEPHPPRPRLLVVGGLPVARALAHLGRAMSYHVILADPDQTGGAVQGADELLTDLDALAARVTPLTFAVVATHGHYDELALERLLPTAAPYVGLVASRARADAVRRYLADQGLTPAQIGRLRAPAGLDLGARRGDEIALSIMAEIVAARRHPAPEPAPATAACPVCATEVAVAGAKFTLEHAGATYYFCCPGCRYVFAKDPGQYVLA